MQGKLKKATGWLHLWLGLVTGAILIIVALTGSLLTFEDELETLLFRHDHVVTIEPNQRLPVDSLIKIAQASFPEKKVSRVTIPAEADRSVEIRMGIKGESKGAKVLFINPYNGLILYQGDYSQRFFQQVRNLHRYLLLGSTGKIITGISCSITLFMVISGLIIWWPANKKAIKQRFRIKWNASGKRLTWDLHAVSGFYVSIILLLITLTGLIWSYDWPEKLIFRLTDGTVEKEAKIKNASKGKQANAGIYQQMLNQTDQLYPYRGELLMAIPPKATLAVTVQKEDANHTITTSNAAFFDSKTGAMLKKQPYQNLSTGTKIRKMMLPVHTGSLLGWPTKLLYLLVSLFTASLPVTGLLIWLNRKKKGSAARAKKRHPVLTKKKAAYTPV
ncbi:PepSY-associated TM helix domain-containing protein [Mucilaginibacter paludis]|nr:PepSY-associated TM helix domain-containing protein [Mucilaginibacter paludis]